MENTKEKVEKKADTKKLNKSKQEIAKIHNSIITSFSARAIAVRKVTTNSGKKTPGIDSVI